MISFCQMFLSGGMLLYTYKPWKTARKSKGSKHQSADKVRRSKHGKLSVNNKVEDESTSGKRRQRHHSVLDSSAKPVKKKTSKNKKDSKKAKKSRVL